MLEYRPMEELQRHADQTRAAVRAGASSLPTQAEFIARYCGM
jgi:hypothetical protein